MRFRFRSRWLALLFAEERGARRYPPQVIDAFFDVMSVIAAAASERDLYALRSSHFEKLSGDRAHQHSLRLNDQFRLLVSIEEDDAGRYLLVLDITDYH